MGDLERSRRLNQMMEKGLVASALVPREEPLMEDATDAAKLLDRDYELLVAPSS
jgi:hypothetical protein